MNITKHARERMEEMGVSVNQVYAMVEKPSLTYINPREKLVLASEVCPGYLLVLTPDQGTLITVSFRTNTDYVRQGETAEIIPLPPKVHVPRKPRKKPPRKRRVKK